MSSPKQPSSQKLQFTSLPPEIRHQIWTLTLPSRRILVLCYDGQKDHRIFRFLHHYPSPIILQVCRDSRAAALSQGFFFTLNDSGQSVYFIPKTDIIYLDDKAVTYLKTADSIGIPSLAMVLNVGFDWTHLFCLAGSVPHKKCWRRAVKRLYIHMPLLKTLNHITLDRSKMRQRELAIEPFSEKDKTWWIETHNNTFKRAFPPWSLVKSWVEDALDGSKYQPEILGWKLDRS